MSQMTLKLLDPLAFISHLSPTVFTLWPPPKRFDYKCATLLHIFQNSILQPVLPTTALCKCIHIQVGNSGEDDGLSTVRGVTGGEQLHIHHLTQQMGFLWVTQGPGVTAEVALCVLFCDLVMFPRPRECEKQTTLSNEPSTFGKHLDSRACPLEVWTRTRRKPSALRESSSPPLSFGPAELRVPLLDSPGPPGGRLPHLHHLSVNIHSLSKIYPV